MASSNNLIRSPPRSINTTPNVSSASQNCPLSLEDLMTLVSYVATDIFRQRGLQIVQATLNPNVDLANARVQKIA